MTQFVLFLRWLHRRMANDAIMRQFVADLAQYHLPHLYHVDRKFAEHFGIEIPDPPPVRFVQLNGPIKEAAYSEAR